MGLFTTLLNTAGSIQVFTRALNTIQNNVTNANTPGFAKQTQTLQAMPFDTANASGGGVQPGPILSSRSEYDEQAVRTQQSLLGESHQKASDLATIEPLFSLTSTTGISTSLSNLFNSFSQLSVNPSDESSRQAVINQAGALAQSFNETANGIGTVASNVQQQTTQAITNINQLTSDLAGLNKAIDASSTVASDPSVDARVHTDLEQLSQYADITALKQSDGTFSIYLGGQTPLVLGDTQFQLQATSVTSQTQILDSQGNDVTEKVQNGQLGALIDENNNVIPSYMSDLNTLAQSVADQVNNTLAGGVDNNGNVPSVNLFSYNATTGAAATLAVTSITPDQIAAASAAAPGGNGNALAVAALANAPVLNGASFTEFYGNLGARVGQDMSTAQADQTTQQDLVTQAQNQRQQDEGVSIDEEAAQLIQFQSAYQAAGQMLAVVNSLTQTLMNIIPPQG